MGRFPAKIDYENIRNARISQNQARLASLGLQKTISELRSMTTPATSPKKKYVKFNRSSSLPLRRSNRLTQLNPNSSDASISIPPSLPDSSTNSPNGHVSEEGENRPAKFDYENIRNARISENQARLASLGLQKTISELRSMTTPAKSPKRKYVKSSPSSLPLRRSNRLKQLNSNSSDGSISTPLSLRFPADSSTSSPNGDVSEEEEKRPANAPLVDERLCRSADVSSEIRCTSKGRGSIYDPVFGICCHFCRQKKLCGEEDCIRCNDRDVSQPCLGKTDCSVCHSTNGVLCRACLKVRYGEEMEEVRSNKQWKCPHCIEAEGTKAYWICNSSICLKKRKIAPTGIAIFRAREMGYESVAHLLMDELQQRADRR